MPSFSSIYIITREGPKHPHANPLPGQEGIDPDWKIQCPTEARIDNPVGTIFRIARMSESSRGGFYVSRSPLIKVGPADPELAALLEKLGMVHPEGELPSRLALPPSPSSRLVPTLAPVPVALKYPRRPKDFFVEQEIWEALIFNAREKINTMLVGPHGCGKSELVYAVGKALDTRVEPFNMGAMTEPRTSLIGTVHLSAEKTFFRKSRFARFVSKDVIVLMDEISRAGEDASNLLLPLLDGQGFIALDEALDEDIVERGPDVHFISTANIGGEYTGTLPMDAAQIDRWVVVELEYLPIAEETKLLQRRWDCPKLVADKIAKMAADCRKMWKEGKLGKPFSVRMSQNAARYVGKGFTPKRAIQIAVLPVYSASGVESDRSKVRKLISGM